MDILNIFLSDFDKGGIIMWIIFFVTIVAWMTGVEKLVSLWQFGSSRKKFLLHTESICKGNSKGIGKTGFENYDLLLDQLQQCLKHNGRGCKGMMREFLISTVPYLDKHFSTMSAWISVAPLLGLLGTVIGMVETFRIIMNFGVGNPSLTAEGISVALLTTQAGLTAAFPAMIFHNYLFSKKNALVSKVLKDCEQIVSTINNSLSKDMRGQNV